MPSVAGDALSREGAVTKSFCIFEAPNGAAFPLFGLGLLTLFCVWSCGERLAVTTTATEMQKNGEYNQQQKNKYDNHKMERAKKVMTPTKETDVRDKILS